MRTLHTVILLLLLAALLAACGTSPSAQPIAQQATATPLPTETLPAPSPTATLTPAPIPPSPTPTPLPTTTAVPPADTPAPAPELSAGPPPGQVQITIVYDNTAVEPGLAAEWGFAAWIDYGDRDILFDTGPGGSMLLGNLAQLGLDPTEIDIVIVSHEHGDHTGGLISLLQTGVQPLLYVPSGFSSGFKRLLSDRTDLVEVEGPAKILPGLHSTGELWTSIRGSGGALTEQALVIETSEGSVVITGCAHPGVVPIVRAARRIVPGDVALAMGGFHLLDKTSSAVDAAASTLRELGVKRVSPTHCTGEQAIARFATAYGEDYIEGGAGRVYTLGSPSLGSSIPVSEAIASLEGLSFEEFLDESYIHLLRRSPESITALGLSEKLGQRNDRLDDLSDAYLRETQELETAVLDLLRGYERDSLSPAQGLSYDLYEHYLDMQVQGHRFAYHDYPVHHFIGSYHWSVDGLFAEIHPLESIRDVEDYIARLSLVDDQVAQFLEGLELREELGVIPPDFIVDLGRESIVEYLGSGSTASQTADARQLGVYTRLDDALDQIGGINAEQAQQFRDAALREIEASFVPAFLALEEHLEDLATVATPDAGAWKLPDGDEYYAYMLRLETSTELTPAEIHAIGLDEVMRIQAEMREALLALGYPEEEGLSELMDRAARDSGWFDISTQAGKDQYIDAIEATIEGAEQAADAVFDLRPAGQVVVIGGPTGGYYVAGAPDGSRPGSYHVSLGGQWRSRMSMPTIAYHETSPGHHFQIAIAQGLDLPYARRNIRFTAYTEGWALYAEQLAWELGLYDGDPYGNLGRLQGELLRAVRLVTDTGIHAMHWSREQARAYMDQAMGSSHGRFSYEVDRYVVLPAQATAYKIGMLKIVELRQRAMDRLGDKFDIKQFHNVVLGNGSLPLGYLERVVEDYIESVIGDSS
jgi:uncharacterized protein (DUF885 family)/metal-dependent hydrolase (beta-lactamase superfamily II)